MPDIWGSLLPVEPGEPAGLEKPKTFSLIPVSRTPPPAAPEEQAWQAERLGRYTEAYRNLKAMGDAQYGTDEKAKQEELQKIQLSFFLAERMGTQPETVYKAWDSRGYNQYAEGYFKSRDLPSTWWGYMRDEVDRSIKSYQQINLMSKAFASPMAHERLQVAGAPGEQYDTSLFKQWADIERSKPAPSHIAAKGLAGWIATIPATVIQQAPYMADLLGAEGLGAAAGGLLGSLAGPEGTVIGAQIGRKAVGFLEASRVGSAQIFQQIMTTPDPETGKPLWEVTKNPEQIATWARVSSLIGGVLTAVPMTVGFEAAMGQLGKKAAGMGLSAIEDATKKGIVQSSVGEFLKKYGKNVSINTAMMPVQNIINQIANDAAIRKVNAREGTDYPTADWQTYGKLISEGLSVGLQTGAIFSLPGSVREARASLAETAQRIGDAKARSVIENVDRISAKPILDQIPDIEARLAELKTEEASLQPKIDALPKGKALDEKTINAHKLMKSERDLLEFQLEQARNAMEKAQATEPYQQGTRAEWEAKNALKPPDEEAAAPERTGGPEDQPGGHPGAAEARTGEIREQDIVNPIPRNVSTIEKVRALQRLSAENQPILDRGLEVVRREMGLDAETAKSNLKKEAKIIEKAARPVILKKKPWHDVEHIRDALRFKMVGTNFEDFGRALGIMLNETGAEVVNLDTEKLFHPKDAWGWRFAGADFRMPNGQLVEFYMPLRELEAAKKSGNHDLYDKWRDVPESQAVDNPEYVKDLRTSNQRYQDAFDAALRRLGMDAATAEASWISLRDSAFGLSDVPSISKLSLRSSAEGAPLPQIPPTLTSEKPPSEAGRSSAANTLPSSESRATIQPMAVPPSTNIPYRGESFKSYGEDVSPSSPVVAKIRVGLPNLTVEQAQGAALYAKLLATHVGMGLDEWVGKRFIPGIFSKEKEAYLESIGKSAGIHWNEIGKAIFETTTKSTFSSWVHELTHAFTYDLTDAERTTVDRFIGARGQWTRNNHEDFADSALAYIATGHAPNAELEQVFSRFARWINTVYESAKVEWTVSPEIVAMYDKALGDMPIVPKEHMPEDAEILFETDPAARTREPQDMLAEDFLRQSQYSKAWRSMYFDENGQRKHNSYQVPADTASLKLREGMWLVDDGFKGNYGHELAQLRRIDPATVRAPGEEWNPGDIRMTENLVLENAEGRGWHAEQYAAWMKEGKEPPPITLIENDHGYWAITDGHRRAWAAKQSGTPILAWYWPSTDHPEGLRADGGTGKVLRVGLTYELATGREWGTDTASEIGRPEGMLFASSPHEDSVRQAVAKGKAVPDRVLNEYRDREWAQEEIDRRTVLVEAARASSSFQEFFDWQQKSRPEETLNEQYFLDLWVRAQDPMGPRLSIDERFSAAMDDGTLRYIIGGFTLVKGEQNPEGMKALTPEMRELGKSILAGEDAPAELLARVREQITAEPSKWRSAFKEYLPTEVERDIALSVEATDLPDFVPVLPKVANERFTDRLQDPRKMEEFLRVVGSNELEGKSKFAFRIARRLETERDFELDPIRSRQVLREIRKNITVYREAYAIATQDEGMLRQLSVELDRASQTEEGRLLTENNRLRDEIKKAEEAVRATSLRHTWTIADLDKEKKNAAEARARYEADIQEAKAKLRESVQKVRLEVGQKAEIKDVIKTTLWKKRMAEIRKRNEADLAILKTRVKQVREQGRAAVQREKDRQAIQRYAEYINRPINASIADAEARMIEDIQSRIAYEPGSISDTVKNRLREWRRQNPDAPMPPDLVREIEGRDPRLITAGEMRQLYDQVKTLRQAGRESRMSQLLEERNFIDQNVGAIEKSIMAGHMPKEFQGLGTKGSRRQVKTPALKQALWATWRMNRIAEMLDGGKAGPVTDWLWGKVNDATDETIRKVDGYSTENLKRVGELGLSARTFGKQERIDGLTMTRGEMMGVYIYSQFEDGLFALKEDNHIQEDTVANIIAALSDEEKQYADWMIEGLSSDTDFDRLQKVQLDVSNQRMDRLPRYFPMQRQGLGGSPVLSDLAKELLEMAGKTNRPAPRSGFLKKRLERIEGVSYPALRLDAPAIYMDHINKREFYIANAPLIKRLNRLFDNRDVKAAMADRYGTEMQPLVQKYIAQYTNPNIYRAFEDYGEFSRILRGNVGLSLLGGNLLTILKQLPDIPQLMIQAGPIDGLRAAAQFAASPRKAIQAMWEKAPQMKNRSYDRFIEEMKTLDRNTYERVLKTVGEAGFVALKALDTVTNTIGWTAIYNKTMRQTGNENLAVTAARDFILRKRPAARAKDLAGIYARPGAMSWFLMFTNQQNQQWNILTFDVPQAIKRAIHGDTSALAVAVLDVTGLLVGAIAMGLVVRKGVMTTEGVGQDFLNLLFGNTPFIGNAFEAAIRGQPRRNALDPFGGAYEIGKVLYDVANQAETEKIMRDLQNLMFTGAGTAGFPVLQAKRIYKTIDTGDPWELIGGPPKGGD